jgi:mRNA interferase RelE/StbE
LSTAVRPFAGGSGCQAGRAGGALAAQVARWDLLLLWGTIAAAIVEFITGTLANNPQRLSEPLRRGLLDGYHSARRGDYRVVFRINYGGWNQIQVWPTSYEFRSGDRRPRPRPSCKTASTLDRYVTGHPGLSSHVTARGFVVSRDRSGD